uniref:Uncharacterized protein n=1 Tax=Anguilla anguilla TaxID=7936 RepID=A0A0E9QG05_ANGAN
MNLFNMLLLILHSSINYTSTRTSKYLNFFVLVIV